MFRAKYLNELFHSFLKSEKVISTYHIIGNTPIPMIRIEKFHSVKSQTVDIKM